MDMISTWILPKVSFLAYWYHLYAVIPNIYAELSVFASCQANICDMSAKDRGSNGTMRWSRDFESNTHVITHRNEQFQNWSISDVVLLAMLRSPRVCDRKLSLLKGDMCTTGRRKNVLRHGLDLRDLGDHTRARCEIPRIGCCIFADAWMKIDSNEKMRKE
jgi:hypothetical protein